MVERSGKLTSGRIRRLPEVECLFPKNVSEALSFLEKHNGTVKVIAGGTDLVPQMKRRALTPKYLVSLARIADLNFIYDTRNGLTIGATTTLTEIKESPVINKNYPVISDSVSVMASSQIRNIATLTGNLCNALPSADSAPPLMVLQAKLKIAGPEKERTILVEDLFTGPRKTVLGPYELVTEIVIPPPAGYGVYLKHMLRAEGDLAMVGVAVYLTLDPKKEICLDARIALGAVAPTPIRAIKAEDALKGKPIGNELIEKVAKLASEEAKPIDDIRSSAAYREEMVRVLTKRAIEQSFKMA